MKDSTIRISKNVVDCLKLLKNVKGIKDSHGSVIQDLIHNALLETHVTTKKGYVTVGSVVLKDHYPVVIESITKDKVVFRDGQSILNSSKESYNLLLLSYDVSDYSSNTILDKPI